MTVAGDVAGSRRNEIGWSSAGGTVTSGEAPTEALGPALSVGAAGLGVVAGRGVLPGFAVVAGAALGGAEASGEASGSSGTAVSTRLARMRLPSQPAKKVRWSDVTAVAWGSAPTCHV